MPSWRGFGGSPSHKRSSRQDVRDGVLTQSSLLVAGLGGILLGRLVPEELVALRCIVWALGALLGAAGATLIWTRIIDRMSVFDEQQIVSETQMRERKAKNVPAESEK